MAGHSGSGTTNKTLLLALASVFLRSLRDDEVAGSHVLHVGNSRERRMLPCPSLGDYESIRRSTRFNVVPKQVDLRLILCAHLSQLVVDITHPDIPDINLVRRVHRLSGSLGLEFRKCLLLVPVAGKCINQVWNRSLGLRYLQVLIVIHLLGQREKLGVINELLVQLELLASVVRLQLLILFCHLLIRQIVNRGQHRMVRSDGPLRLLIRSKRNGLLKRIELRRIKHGLGLIHAVEKRTGERCVNRSRRSSILYQFIGHLF